MKGEGAKMKRILIIEDDALITRIYQKRCQTAGFEVDSAPDGKVAIERLKAQPPDVVLLDLMLPHTDGVGVLKFMRSEEALKRVPVLVLSNAYAGSMVDAAWNAGANKCLIKASCSPNQLISEIQGLLLPMPAPAPAAPEPFQPPADGSAGPEKAQAVEASFVDNFLREAPALLAGLRSGFERIEEGDAIKKGAQWLDLFRSVHAIGGRAAAARFHALAQMCSALEALLKELREKPARITPSTRRTVAQALDFLQFLFKHNDVVSAPTTPPLILVIDNKPIAREAFCIALEKAQFRGIGVDDATIALKLLEHNSFDLIYSDLDVPGLNGFELCQQIHALRPNQNTPVVFVTALKQFETHAQSTLVDGADLIAKPFVLVELAVKTLPYILARAARRAGILSSSPMAMAA
jgi:DNA-binding response OmpR family regulator/HPt (histidine-containing phosphotransfer) domain-containing protein